MEDDDLEYDITFPTPVSAESAADQAAFLDRKEPVIILLGWLGCKEKHIAKYGQIYDEKGCITIRYTAPKDVAFFNVGKLNEIACKILDLLDDYSVADNPIIFHIFSNNGSYVYNSIVQVLTSGDKRYQKLQVLGVIVDSAPGKVRITRAAKAFATSQNVNFIFSYVLMLGMIIYLFFTNIRATIKAYFDPTVKEQNEHFLFENLASHPTHWPMLYLYSKADRMVWYRDIEDMMQRRQALGVSVRGMCWDDSDHVAHLRKHPTEYIEICGEFLDFCLGGGSEDDIDMQGFEAEAGLETEEDYLLAKKQ